MDGGWGWGWGSDHMNVAAFMMNFGLRGLDFVGGGVPSRLLF